MTAASTVGFDPIAEAQRKWVEHGWADAATGMTAVTSLMRAQQLVLAEVEARLKPFAVTFARYEVLMLLMFSSSGRLPMKTIGSRLQVHPTSVTNAVDRLEAAGLVARAPHPDDRRAVLVELTPEGRDVATRATRVLNDEVFTRPPVENDDLEALIGILARMRRSAGDF